MMRHMRAGIRQSSHDAPVAAAAAAPATVVEAAVALGGAMIITSPDKSSEAEARPCVTGREPCMCMQMCPSLYIEPSGPESPPPSPLSHSIPITSFFRRSRKPSACPGDTRPCASKWCRSALGVVVPGSVSRRGWPPSFSWSRWMVMLPALWCIRQVDEIDQT